MKKKYRFFKRVSLPNNEGTAWKEPQPGKTIEGETPSEALENHANQIDDGELTAALTGPTPVGSYLVVQVEAENEVRLETYRKFSATQDVKVKKLEPADGDKPAPVAVGQQAPTE